MKQKLTALSRRYVGALRKHLRQGLRAGLQSARDLGCQAAALDLETLDVARIHEEALATLEASSSKDGIIKRVEIFCGGHHPDREDASQRESCFRPKCYLILPAFT